jgi:pimeloyl-ACP methyl ester carboxylesterase
VPTVRLSRHRIQLSDGHSVQALVAGRGVPLVVTHGFACEGLLYAQSLSRLVAMGFKVVALDTAGHGGTAVLPHDG